MPSDAYQDPTVCMRHLLTGWTFLYGLGVHTRHCFYKTQALKKDDFALR